MKYIKKFENFINENETAPAPAKPSTAPTTRPGTAPGKKDRPSPIRRDKPSVSPDPKALKKSSAEDVAKAFIKELSNIGDSVKNYIK